MTKDKETLINDILDLSKELAELKEREEELENNDNEEEYDDMLDDVYGEIDVCGYKYYAGRLLQEIDPVAYNCGHSDYNNSLLSDIQSEIEEKEEEIKILQEELNNL